MEEQQSISISRIDVIGIKQLGDYDIDKISVKSSQGKLNIKSESFEDSDL